MPKRYQGNSGSFAWVEPPQAASPPQPPRPESVSPPPPPPRPEGPPGVGAGAGAGLQLLPKLLGELETEDLILLLLCWLLYRESGDSDWLIVLAALALG